MRRGSSRAGGRRRPRCAGHRWSISGTITRMSRGGSGCAGPLRVGEGVEQLIVEDLDLALRAVGDEEAQAAIAAGIDRAGRRRRSGSGRSSRMSSCSCCSRLALPGLRPQRGLEQIDLEVLGRSALVAGAVVVLIEQADVVAALLAPGRQQWMAVQVQLGLIEVLRDFAGADATVGGSEQLAALDDIAPVMLGSGSARTASPARRERWPRAPRWLGAVARRCQRR